MRHYKLRRAKLPQDLSILREFNRTYFAKAPIKFTGAWWVLEWWGEPVALLGAQPRGDALYFARVAVRVDHRGRGLQRRLMKTMERYARENNYKCIVSDTWDNIPSANNFAVMGYTMFKPKKPWAETAPGVLFWRKCL